MEPDELGQTHISDVSEKDERVLRQLNLLEVTALYDEHHISWTRMRARKKYKGARTHRGLKHSLVYVVYILKRNVPT